MPSYIRDFAVLGEIGRGRYGTVWHADGEIPARPGQPPRRRQVAIKVLRPDTPPAALAALEQEFRLLEQVKHRAIVRVYGWWPDERAIVMEYVRGVTLREVLDTCRQKKEQFYTEAALDLACELADALYQAHTTPGDNGEPLHLVHRDLKPENILLTPGGEVRILDFGLALARNAEFKQERDGLVRGTPLYMAPEQIRGQFVDHRTDLFALGLILFELLTGRPVWGAQPDADALLKRIAGGDLANERREIESMVPGAGTIVARLLSPSPANRYSDGQDVLVDLRRQLYRDRGAGLHEFCDFFFGSLHPLPEPPEAQPMPTPPAPPSRPEPAAAPSADGLSADGGVSRAVPVKRSTRAVPLAAPTAPPVQPADAAPRPVPKIVQRPTPQRAPEIDDDDLPASVRKSAGGPARPRVVGARAPDETGMLPILPIGGSGDGGGPSHDPSATAFFAIPAPKGARPGPVSSPSGAPASGAGAFQPPPVASAADGHGASGARPMVAAGMAPSGPAVAGRGSALGGVAGYGAAAGGPSATPFAVGGPAPAAGSSAETRVQSQRVWAVVLGVMFLGGMAVLLVIGIVLWNQFHNPTSTTTTTVATTTPPVVVPTPEPEPEPEPEPATTTRKPTGTKSTTKTTTATTTVAAPPVGATGPVGITFTGSSLPTSATLQCGDNKMRASVSGGRVSFANVPTGEDCVLRPSSALTFSPARNIRGGRNFTCDVTDFNTTCR